MRLQQTCFPIVVNITTMAYVSWCATPDSCMVVNFCVNFRFGKLLGNKIEKKLLFLNVFENKINKILA